MERELTLSALRPGEKGRVRAMRVSGPARRRLRELGLVEGADNGGKARQKSAASFHVRGHRRPLQLIRD